jgi:hypothetical protein
LAESESSLGNIFDITYMHSEGTWRDFKVTFVRNEWSCEEFLLFDTSHEDLSAATAEVYQAIDTRLDLMNQQVLLGFLRQTEVTERSYRMTKKYTKPFLPGFSFSYADNARLTSSYKDVDKGQITLDIEQLVSQVLSHKDDFVTQAFSLIELQKLTQVSLIARYAHRLQSIGRGYGEIREEREVYAQHQEVPAFEKVRNMLISSSDDLSVRKRYEIDSAAAHIAEIMTKRRKEKGDENARRQGIKVPERSCASRAFGDACDCHIF